MRRRRRKIVYAGRGGIRREVGSILFGGARRSRLASLWATVALVAGGTGAAVAVARELESPAPVPHEHPAVGPGAAPPVATPLHPHRLREPLRVGYRRSRAIGLPHAGRLVRGVRLPAGGPDFFTWDPVLERSPNRPWRRHGTDRLVRVVMRVVREYREQHPRAPRVGIGDLSRPQGGDFGRRYGSLGHASHQNGLDADLYYPRLDRRERRPERPEQVDRRLAQELVDAFVAAGAGKVFVGPSLGLRGPRSVVAPLVHHDDHMHVRMPNRGERRT